MRALNSCVSGSPPVSRAWSRPLAPAASDDTTWEISAVAGSTRQPRRVAYSVAMPVSGCAWQATHPPSLMTRADAARRSGRLRSTASRGPGATPAAEGAATLVAAGLEPASAPASRPDCCIFAPSVWRLADARGDRRIGSVIEKHPDDSWLRPIGADRPHQRGHAARVARIDRCTGVQQKLDDRGARGSRRHVQRGQLTKHDRAVLDDAIVVRGHGVDIRFARQQQTRELRVAVERGAHERRRRLLAFSWRVRVRIGAVLE